MNQEKIRLEQSKANKSTWKKWGPYLTERQWGTVREDYSPNGTAWENTSPMMRHTVGRITGTKKALAASVITDNCSVLPWHLGMGKTPF